MPQSLGYPSLAVALFVLLPACASRPAPPAYAYQTGYETGCARGYSGDGATSSPYASDEQFRQGWQNGYAACAARNSAALRPFLN